MKPWLFKLGAVFLLIASIMSVGSVALIRLIPRPFPAVMGWWLVALGPSIVAWIGFAAWLRRN